MKDLLSKLDKFDHWELDFRRRSSPKYGLDIRDDRTGEEWTIMGSMVSDSLEECINVATKNAQEYLDKNKEAPRPQFTTSMRNQ